jgi:hypothetical protein
MNKLCFLSSAMIFSFSLCSFLIYNTCTASWAGQVIQLLSCLGFEVATWPSDPNGWAIHHLLSYHYHLGASHRQ